MTFAEAKADVQRMKRELDQVIRAGEWERAAALAHEFSERVGDVAGLAFEEGR